MTRLQSLYQTGEGSTIMLGYQRIEPVGLMRNRSL